MSESLDFNRLQSLVVDRTETFTFLASKIREIEASLEKVDYASISVNERFALYDQMVKTQISYMEALRRFLSQVDMEEVLRTIGIGALAERLKNLSPVSIGRISEILDSCGVGDNGG